MDLDRSICGGSSSLGPCGAVRDRTNGIAEPILLRSLDGIDIDRLLPLLLRARLGGPEVEVMLGFGEITSLLLLIDDGSPVGCCSPIRSCTCMVCLAVSF